MKKVALKATAQEKKVYVLRTRADIEILAGCKRLQKLRLAKRDNEIVKLIKTQLKREWRKPLLQKLNKLLKRYTRRSK